VEGGDLFDRIVEHGKYDESGARLLVRSMALAIEHMHGLGVIHRDLKPENCLVTKDEHGNDVIKLADFGLSVVLAGDLHPTCGPPTHVAPGEPPPPSARHVFPALSSTCYFLSS